MSAPNDFEILKNQLHDFEISRNIVKEKIYWGLIEEKNGVDKILVSNICAVLFDDSLLEKLVDIKLLGDIYGFLSIMVGSNDIERLNCFFPLLPYKNIFSSVGYDVTRDILYEKAGFSTIDIDAKKESEFYKSVLNIDIHDLLLDLDRIRNLGVPKRVVHSNSSSNRPSAEKSFLQ